MIWLYLLLGIIALLCLLLLIACLRAALAKAPGEPDAPAAVPLSPQADTYASHLSQLIRIETITDPKGEKLEAFHKFHAALKELFPLVHQAMEQQVFGGALLYRWKGKNPDAKPLLLMSHMDVVPALGNWKHDPFGGEIIDGFIWGRGTVDTKGSLCAFFEAAEALIKDGFVPQSDIYLASSDSEEISGPGAPRTAAYLKEQGVTLGLLLDEGGSVTSQPVPGVRHRFAMLGVAEKGHGNVCFTVKSDGGHSSVPPKSTPMVRLARLILDIENHFPFRLKIDGAVKEMLRVMAPHMDFKMRFFLCNAWLFSPVLPKIVANADPKFAAMLGTTCVFTMSGGSSAANVIPAEATATANLRFIPHQGMAESVSIICERAKRFGVEGKLLKGNDSSGTADITGQRYQTLVSCVKELFPGAGVSPSLVLGGTDAKSYGEVCDCCIRFSPMELSPEEGAGVHSVDEHLSVAALDRAVTFYKRVMETYPG